MAIQASLLTYLHTNHRAPQRRAGQYILISLLLEAVHSVIMTEEAQAGLLRISSDSVIAASMTAETSGSEPLLVFNGAPLLFFFLSLSPIEGPYFSLSGPRML